MCQQHKNVSKIQTSYVIDVPYELKTTVQNVKGHMHTAGHIMETFSTFYVCVIVFRTEVTMSIISFILMYFSFLKPITVNQR